MERVLQTDWLGFFEFNLPWLIVCATALFFLLVTSFIKKDGLLFFTIAGSISLIASFCVTWLLWLRSNPLTLQRLSFDRLSYGFDLIFLMGALLTVFLSLNYLKEEKMKVGEYFVLLFFSLTGAMIVAHAADLIVLFLGIEIMSLAAYILAGLKKGSIRSYEASLKYFILGSFASGFLLFGIALLYGAMGSTSFASLQRLVMNHDNMILVTMAVAFLFVGMAFKIAAVPFHLWSLDVYEGAPTPVTAFFASVIKAAGFAVLIRILLQIGHLTDEKWIIVLQWLAMATMTIGNLVALKQTNIKRLLACSSVAHAGYILVGVVAGLKQGTNLETTFGAVLFYLIAYSLTTLGAFGVVIALGKRGDQAEEISDLSGLAESHPVLAFSLAVFLFSLTGFPPTVGFIGKFYLFAGAAKAGLMSLVIVGVINSVISAYYYLNPIVKMYFQGEKPSYELPPISYSLVTAIFICLFVVLYAGVMPSELFLMARESVRELVF